METMTKATPSAANDRLMFVLKMRGPMKVAELARRLGVTGEAARQQLLRLAEDGLVAMETRAGGVGRPAQLWRLTQEGHARFPDTHADLTVQLLSVLKSEFGDEGVDRIIRQRENVTRAAYSQAMAGAETLEARLRILADLRTREGYMSEVERADDGGWLLSENHCPICIAASACQGFCRSELDLFRDALGPQAQIERVEHIIAGARRCAYRVMETAAA